ncbi:ester cyclase [Streptomyces sp. 8N706]|uniref:ester cyclase n=1 Tax=Streptomyces sp. 8N706 TaxID=3457416 RepID=UPI003FD101E5
MTFVQIIDCKTDKFDDMNRLLDTWAEQTKGKRTATHALVGRDRSNGEHYVEIIEFPSYEEAMRNSSLPETEQIFREMVAICDAPPTFTDLDVVRDEALNKETARRFYDEVAVGGRLDLIDELFAPDVIDHDMSKEEDTTVGSDVLRQDVTGWRNAFAFDFTIESMVAEGDEVTTLWTWRGTHRGDFMGIRPTGRDVTMTGTTVYRFQDGKIQETWWHYDIPRLLRELNAAPT